MAADHARARRTAASTTSRGIARVEEDLRAGGDREPHAPGRGAVEAQHAVDLEEVEVRGDADGTLALVDHRQRAAPRRATRRRRRPSAAARRARIGSCSTSSRLPSANSASTSIRRTSSGTPSTHVVRRRARGSRRPRPRRRRRRRAPPRRPRRRSPPPPRPGPRRSPRPCRLRASSAARKSSRRSCSRGRSAHRRAGIASTTRSASPSPWRVVASASPRPRRPAARRGDAWSASRTASSRPSCSPRASSRRRFVPAAGMIGCSLRHRGERAARRSAAGSTPGAGRGKSFGLPLLHPWANRLRDWRYAAAGRAVEIDRSRGHRPRRRARPPDPRRARRRGGLGRRRRAAPTSDAARLVADARLRPPRRPARRVPVPAPPDARARARAATRSRSRRRSRPTGDDEVPLAFGWHPWLVAAGRAAGGVGARRCPRATSSPLDERSLPDRRADAGAPPSAAPLGDRVLDDHFESPRTRASRSPAAAARSPSSGRAATATRRSSRRRRSTSSASSR